MNKEQITNYKPEIWKYGLTVLIERLQEIQEEGKSILVFIKEQYGDE